MHYGARQCRFTCHSRVLLCILPMLPLCHPVRAHTLVQAQISCRGGNYMQHRSQMCYGKVFREFGCCCTEICGLLGSAHKAVASSEAAHCNLCSWPPGSSESVPNSAIYLICPPSLRSNQLGGFGQPQLQLWAWKRGRDADAQTCGDGTSNPASTCLNYPPA